MFGVQVMLKLSSSVSIELNLFHSQMDLGVFLLLRHL